MTAPEAPVPLLVLADSDGDAEFLRRELAAQGFAAEIRLARGRAEFERALAEFSPAAVLSEYRVPGFEATEALAAARAARPGIPFLCVSGAIGEEQAVELLKAGATDYVLKDKPSRLSPCLRRALAEARERAERRLAEEELRAGREQLQQSQCMETLGRLAGAVAHDFNNILTTISGYGELMLQQLPPDSPHRDEVGEILAAAGRAKRLTGQLLAFGRRQVFELRVLDLNEVVRGVQRMLARRIGEDVKIELRLDPALRRVTSDVNQLELVLTNLAANARDAMPRGGVLRLSTRADGDFVELTAADTGVGMPPEVRARLFEPFFTTKEKGKGTGLGLSTVYGIVRQSGGTISVDSAPGRGASFLIRLPATDDAADSGPHAAPASLGNGGREIVLVVEDEPPLRRLLERVLSEHGYRAIVAADPDEALKAFAELPRVDLAVVDVVMPGLDGPALVARLRERLPSLKALFISGDADQARLPSTENGRSFAFLAKPFAASALLAKVRETIDAASA